MGGGGGGAGMQPIHQVTESDSSHNGDAYLNRVSVTAVIMSRHIYTLKSKS